MMKMVSLICLLNILFTLSINSQEKIAGINYLSRLPLSGEKIRLFTDRNIYCVNERIFYTAEYKSIKQFDSIDWSKVLYVELIRWNGNKLGQMKIKLIRPSTSGSMEIPGNIPSGNYYLRAYTKWMRNFPPNEYAYVPVKIVNPLGTDTDEGPAEKQPETESVMFRVHQGTMINGVSCTLNMTDYKPGEKAEVSFSINDKKYADIDRYCVSVTMAGAVDTAGISPEPDTSSPGRDISRIEYLPEIRGITVSGEIVDKSTKIPQKNVLVSLSQTQSGEYFSVYTTNDQGRFVFSLPDLTGQLDFFIQKEPGDSIASEIKIDNGYCNKPVKLAFTPFSLNKAEIVTVRNMVINQQLNERFRLREDTLKGSGTAQDQSLSFYGSKRAVYYTEKYIELPNIEEFIYEIVMEATISYEKGKASSIIFRRAVPSYFPPLILMDNIQVSNDDRILKTPLNRIKKIEIINSEYVIGETIYGGIISIFSDKNDFAGIDLNKNSMFFVYDFYSDQNVNNYSGNRSDNLRIPDRRNLLYWNPDIQISADKQTTINFNTSDCKGEYVIYLRGKNTFDDSEIFGKCLFSVK